MNHQLYLAELDMKGSYGPLIWAFLITFAIAACSVGLWTFWRTPARIQKRIRKDNVGLIELKNEFHLRLRDWFLSFGIAIVLTTILFIIFYLLLYKEKYVGLPFWQWLTDSMLYYDTFFGEFRPMPYGILASVLVGGTFGLLLGFAFGKKNGAKRLLLTSYLLDPVKF